MITPSLRPIIAAGLLTLSGVASAATPPYQAQDLDHPLACCLASEWTLTAAEPAGEPQTPQAQPGRSTEEQASAKCQTELGDLSCCIAAEWILPGTVEASEDRSAPSHRDNGSPAESFCCLASEYFAQ